MASHDFFDVVRQHNLLGSTATAAGVTPSSADDHVLHPSTLKLMMEAARRTKGHDHLPSNPAFSNYHAGSMPIDPPSGSSSVGKLSRSNITPLRDQQPKDASCILILNVSLTVTPQSSVPLTLCYALLLSCTGASDNRSNSLMRSLLEATSQLDYNVSSSSVAADIHSDRESRTDHSTMRAPLPSAAATTALHGGCSSGLTSLMDAMTKKRTHRQMTTATQQSRSSSIGCTWPISQQLYPTSISNHRPSLPISEFLKSQSSSIFANLPPTPQLALQTSSHLSQSIPSMALKKQQQHPAKRTHHQENPKVAMDMPLSYTASLSSPSPYLGMARPIGDMLYGGGLHPSTSRYDPQVRNINKLS